MRHVLEHCQDMPEVAAALKELVAADGRIVFEVPDASRALEHLDYTTISGRTRLLLHAADFAGTLESLGFTVESLHNYPYSHENSLVAVVRPGPSKRRFLGPCRTSFRRNRPARLSGENLPRPEKSRHPSTNSAQRTVESYFLGAGAPDVQLHQHHGDRRPGQVRRR